MKLLYLLSDTAAISFLFVIRIGYSSCQRNFRTKWIAHNASCIAYESHGHTMCWVLLILHWWTTKWVHRMASSQHQQLSNNSWHRAYSLVIWCFFWCWTRFSRSRICHENCRGWLKNFVVWLTFFWKKLTKTKHKKIEVKDKFLYALRCVLLDDMGWQSIQNKSG